MKNYNRQSGGRGWRQTADGYIDLEHAGVVRTRGAPTSMRTLLDDHGAALRAASSRFGLRPELLCAVIGVEATRLPGSLRFDVACRRYEKRLGESSVGLMQTLVSTAQAMNARYKIYPGRVTEEDLAVGERSIMLGACHLRHLADHSGRGWACPAGEDPILLSCAYNAGGVYTSTRNPWKIRTHGTDRIERFAAWYNDAKSVLDERNQ